MTENTTTQTVEVNPNLVIQLDPRELLIDANARIDTDSTVDKDFIESIRELGVMQPLLVARTVDGQARVEDGHRRTLGAIAADRASVPVIVFTDDATDDAAKRDRLLRQINNNHQREGWTNADKVQHVAQLAAFGVKPAEIRKRTKYAKSEVTAAAAVMESELARKSVARWEFLTLEQAAVIAEFEDDPDTVKALVAAVETGQFEHVAQRARDERDRQAARAELAHALTSAGYTVVERFPEDGKPRPVELSRLTDDPETRVPLSAAAHQDCPGHAVTVTSSWGDLTADPLAYLANYDTAEDDEDDYNDDVDEDEDDPAERDERPYGSRCWPTLVCTEPHRHQERWRSHSDGPKKMAEMSEAEQEAARADRRDVLESNKAWRSAETVRREWLRTFLTRKTAPKGAAGFVATALATDPTTVTETKGTTLAADLLGLDKHPGYGRHPGLVELIEKASDARAQVLSLAQVLAGYEAATGTHSWRHVGQGTKRYLEFLATNNYDLSPVEMRACGQTPAEDTATPDEELAEVS